MLFPFENATCVFMLAKICVMLHIYRYGYYTILLKFPPLRFLTFQTIFNAVSLVPRQLSSLVVIAILTIELQSYFVAGGMCCRGMLNVFFCHQSWQLHRRKWTEQTKMNKAKCIVEFRYALLLRFHGWTIMRFNVTIQASHTELFDKMDAKFCSIILLNTQFTRIRLVKNKLKPSVCTPSLSQAVKFMIYVLWSFPTTDWTSIPLCMSKAQKPLEKRKKWGLTTNRLPNTALCNLYPAHILVWKMFITGQKLEKHSWAHKAHERRLTQ